MRRDYFTLEAENVDWVETDDPPAKPAVHIDFEGPAKTLRERLTGPDGAPLEAAETDIAFRLQDPVEADGATGVVSVTDRLTGGFILELNRDAEDVLDFIRAARRYGEATEDDDGYAVHISIDGDEFVSYDKRTFLVYNDEGNLLRSHSLIPSGVEL